MIEFEVILSPLASETITPCAALPVIVLKATVFPLLEASFTPTALPVMVLPAEASDPPIVTGPEPVSGTPTPAFEVTGSRRRCRDRRRSG